MNFVTKTRFTTPLLYSQIRTNFQKPLIHLVLFEDVQGLGAKGDIVLTSVGYARNSLVPLQKAYYLPRYKGKPILPDNYQPPKPKTTLVQETITPAIITVPYHEQSSGADPTTTIDGQITESQIRLYLTGKTIEFKRVRITPDSSKIFGSVTPADISAALFDSYGITFPKENIDGKFKDLGMHDCTLIFTECDPLVVRISIAEDATETVVDQVTPSE